VEYYPGRATMSFLVLLHVACPVKKEHRPITEIYLEWRCLF
jgi:hypothetical protein